MSDTEATPVQRMLGDFSPAFVELTDDLLFGDIWQRPGLTPRDRSLITVATLIANGSTDQLVGHLGVAQQNGLTPEELKEAMIHLAFYAGWPRALSALLVAKNVFPASTD
ncbi:carboxymuconolactone decarboxylase family protein [Microbacterium sp. X-17]|uniref:carboxymuconolactone decarboxylase family protein n=1 Tax=Microbacterium sp. X-17 TaxID=3144404 RepID=UPI0031F5D49F